MSTATFYQGMGPPYVVAVTVPATSEFVPTACTGAVFHVTNPNGVSLEWTPEITSTSSSALTLEYSLQTTDLNLLGTWKFWVECDVPGGSIRTQSISFIVYAANF